MKGEGGGLDFLTQRNPGVSENLQNQGREKKRGEEEFFKFSLGAKLLEIKLQTENKISEQFKNAFMSYKINYLSNSTFLWFFQYKLLQCFHLLHDYSKEMELLENS